MYQIDNNWSLYLQLRSKKLGSHFTFPSDCIDSQEFRLVDMHSSASTVEMKEKFLMSFSKVDSTLRVLIATTAFGIGVDIPNIRWIVHWSPQDFLKIMSKRLGELEEMA